MQQSKPPEGKSLPMINSFLNLCRVCPVPTEDKVNSEYKRNFTWHDGYQATKVDVVRNAPSMPSAEPSHPSRKQFPPVRDHLMHDEGGEEVLPDVGQLGLADCRARSEERRHFKSRASPRSRSADSTISRRLRAVAIPDEDTRPPPKDDADSKKAEEKQPLMSQSFPPLSTQPRGNPGTPGPPEEGGRVPPHTEYRSQFVAYPHQNSPTTRKSASMGLIAQKDALDGDAPSGEPWSAVPTEDDDDAALDAVKRGRIKKTEYKAKFRPFSAYTYVDGSWKKATRLIKERAADDMDLYSSYSYPLFDGGFIVANSQTCTATLEKSPRTIIITIEIGTSVGPSEMRLIGAQEQQECDGSVDQHAWYSEVVERLKKADQYRTRSHAGMPLYSSEPIEFLARDRTVLSPVSVASSSRTWKDDRPLKERGRPVPVHHRKEKKDAQDSSDHPKSREGSTKKKSHVEKVTVRPKSAEPVIPVKSEHKSPKRSRPRAPRDLPVHGHGDLSGKKKATRQSSPSKPRAVHRPAAAEGKVWLKPDEAKETLVNGFSEDKMVNGEADDSVQHETEQDKVNGEYPVFRAPAKVPLTTVKSPEEVTGVRSPDPESWTVPLEIGKGLHWMDGKTPDGVQAKGPPVLLSKRLKESSLVGKSQKDLVLYDAGSEATGESVDL